MVNKGDKGPWTMNCLIVEDCIESPNPWFDQEENQVENATGITVTPKPVAGASTVVDWKLTFTDLPLNDIAGDYTCRASPFYSCQCYTCKGW